MFDNVYPFETSSTLNEIGWMKYFVKKFGFIVSFLKVWKIKQLNSLLTAETFIFSCKCAIFNKMIVFRLNVI
jgi:hypothetical protein